VLVRREHGDRRTRLLARVWRLLRDRGRSDHEHSQGHDRDP
ncbi:MAG: hypothetical protein RLZZ53_2144, partial [Acidobacteriota bacterium]|jgi:hypothetical protein